MGMDKLKQILAGLAEPALIFAATGSKAAAIWGGMKAVLMSKVLGPISLLSGAAIGLLGTFKLLVGQSQLLAKGMSVLREMETIKTQFDPLLGGAARAQQRIEELYNFAATTPFRLAEIAEASKTLEVLTKGAMSTGESLRMVGDAAAVSGQSMQTVAFWTGRLYDALKNGQPIGEATARMQEMGLIAGATRNKLREMQEGGESFVDTMAVFEESMSKTEGGMDKLSKTLGGLESTLADVRGQFQARFAENFMEGEKMAVSRLTELFAAFIEPVARLGAWLGKLATMFAKVFTFIITGGGLLKDMGKAMSYLVDAIVAFGLALAGVQLMTFIQGIKRGTAAIALNTIFVEANALKTVWNANIQKGLVVALKAVGAEWMAATVKAKIAGIMGLFVGGVWKGVTVIFGLLKAAAKAAFGALLTGPGAIIAVIAMLVVGLIRLFDNMEENRKKTEELKKASEEAADAFEEEAAAVKTLDDKLALLKKTKESLKSAREKATELAVEGGDVGPIGGLMGEDNTTQRQAQAEEIERIHASMRELVNLDLDMLELAKERVEMLKEERKLREKMQDLMFEAQDMGASTAEKLVTLQERKMYTDTKSDRSRKNKSEEVEGKEKERRMLDEQGQELTGLKIEEDVLTGYIDNLEAELESFEEITGSGSRSLGGSFSNLIFGGGKDAQGNDIGRWEALGDLAYSATPVVSIAKSVADVTRMSTGRLTSDQEAAKWRGTADGMRAEREAIRAKRTQAIKRHKEEKGELIFGETAKKMSEKDFTDMVSEIQRIQKSGGTVTEESLRKSGLKGELGPGGLRRMLQGLYSDKDFQAGASESPITKKLDPNKRKALKSTIDQMKEEGDQWVDLLLKSKKMADQIKEKNRQLQLGIALLEAESKKHEAIRNLMMQSGENKGQAVWNKQLKALNISLEEATDKYRALQEMGNEATSIGDLEEKERFWAGDKATTRTKEQQKEINELELKGIDRTEKESERLHELKRDTVGARQATELDVAEMRNKEGRIASEAAQEVEDAGGTQAEIDEAGKIVSVGDWMADKAMQNYTIAAGGRSAEEDKEYKELESKGLANMTDTEKSKYEALEAKGKAGSVEKRETIDEHKKRMSVSDTRVDEMRESTKKGIADAKDSARELIKAKQAAEKLEDQIAKQVFDAAEKLRRKLFDIAEQAKEISVDFAIDDKDFGKAAQQLRELDEEGNVEFVKRRTQDLLDTGEYTQEQAEEQIGARLATQEDVDVGLAVNEGDIMDALDFGGKPGEWQNRERKKDLMRAQKRTTVGKEGTLDDPRGAIGGGLDRGGGAWQKARLGMFAKVFGDSKAREKLEAIDNRDFMRKEMEDNMRKGFSNEENIELTKRALDTKLMGEVGEQKITADSFRRIGAGGMASSTDPMRRLAEKRTKALAAIEKDMNALRKNQNKQKIPAGVIQ